MMDATAARRRFDQAFAACPLVAILRGVQPHEAVDIGRALVDAGFRLIEVPLNSPRPLDSIAALAQALPQAVVGAGTVLEPAHVIDVQRAGGLLCVSPNFDADVVTAAVARGMCALPGVATPSEAFAALRAGATALKLFPAEMIPPAAVKAVRAVLPAGVRLLPVGGIDPATMAPYRTAGADGFGLGSALYKPGRGAAEVGARAREFMDAWAATIRA